MAWFFSVIATIVSFASPGTLRHERALAVLYTVDESCAMMRAITGKDEVPHIPVVARYDGEAPVAMERELLYPSHQWTVVIERPAVAETDMPHCNPRIGEAVRETWYTICSAYSDRPPHCDVIAIEAICCVSEDPDRVGCMESERSD